MANTPPDTGTTTTTPDTTSTDDATSGTNEANEVEKWKAQAQKHEKLWKAVENSDAAQLKRDLAAAKKELDKVKAETMSDTEKAIQAARNEGKAEATRHLGTKLVDAEFRAALAGRNVDVDALLEGLDRTRFIGDDGDPARDTIAAWVERIAPKVEDKSGTFPDLGQGARGGPSNTALNGDPLLRDLKKTLNIP